MAEIPDELMYTAEHEWVAGAIAPGSIVTIGITDYAAAALGDVVYVEAPEVGDTITADQVCGELESTKAVSELYAPVTGKVTEVNRELADSPDLVNTDAYGAGWIIKVEVSAPNKALLNAEQYAAITE